MLEFLSQRLATDLAAADRFRRRAQAIAALDHPNIVTIYEIGIHEGAPFLAMEYVGRGTLADLLASQTIPDEILLGVALQLGRAVSEVNKAGITLREIRAERVLMDPQGRVCFADFDQLVVDESSKVTMETQTLISSGRPGDGRTGVRLIGELLEGVGAGQPFDEIIARAASEDRDDRYASVEGFVRDLETTLQDRSDLAPGPSVYRRRRLWPLLAVAALIGLVAIYLVARNPFGRAAPGPRAPERKIVAVLPFENLGDAEDEYFADGIIDEITSRLALVRGLGVISRRSSRAYKGTQKSLPQIGDELNADYVLEGSVRWDKSHGAGRVRITPRLIRVADDTDVWSNHYEWEITEIFTVQAEIASQIVDALDVTLLADERRALTARPTDNVEAYQAYLRGMKQIDATDFGRESVELGVQMFRRAVELDPRFALAYARLSSMHSRMVHYGYDRSEERVKQARAAVDRALALRPDLAEVQLALGLYYYWTKRDYSRALAALDAARAIAPNNGEVSLATAYVRRRQGDLEAAIDLFERDAQLSPLDANVAVGLGETYGTLRRYAEGERSFERAIALAPDNAYPYTELALLYLRWRGDTAAARGLVERMPSVRSTEGCRVAFLVELLDRQYPAALERLEHCPGTVLEAGDFFIPLPLYEGMTSQLTGEAARARAAYEQARALLETRLDRDPEDPRIHAALGLTYAGLGRPRDAVRHGRRAVELHPRSRDFLQAPVFVIDLAMIHAMVGEEQAALEQLDSVLSIPSILSVAWLEADPRWDPLRDDPGFAALLREHR